MKKLRTGRSALMIGALVSLPLLASAGTVDPRTERLLSDIDDMEVSVAQSSISARLSEAQKADKLALLDRARDELRRGNHDAAREIVRSIGRAAYEMPEGGRAAHPDALAYLEEVSLATLVMIPEAIGIAREKGADTAPIEEIARRHEFGRIELDNGNAERARPLLLSAYADLQSRVAELRTGDRFVIALPEHQGERAWQDALRRFEDRRAMSEAILIEARLERIDTRPLTDSLERAEALVRSAERLARGRHWEEALSAMDRAYVEVENGWRAVGVDV